MRPRPKILIVDDEPYNLDYLEQELADLDYDTVAAADGQQALDSVEVEAPDLILLDIMMPVMDGFAVLTKLKASPSTREIPVLIISATSDLQSVVKGIELGAEDYLPKPFEPTLLKARMAASLAKKGLRDLEGLYLHSLERELEIAREIQTGFLPSELPIVEGWEVAAYFRSAKEVAGDFYDAFSLPDGKLAIVVADVCGKGVGAALFMTLFRRLIRAASTTDHFMREEIVKTISPAERLLQAIHLTNDYVVETHGDTNMFATVFFGILDPADGALEYINAGNEPPLILRGDGTRAQLGPSGPVVGAIPQAKYSVKKAVLEQDDTFLAFTDGVPDCKNTEDEFFGKERLLALTETPRSTAADLLLRLGHALDEFRAGAEPFDDITVLALRRDR